MFASGGAKGLTGYDSERLVDGTVTLGGDIIHEGDADDVWNAVQDAMDHREDFDIRYRIWTADGDVLRIREQGRGRYNDGGDVVAVEGYIWDPDPSGAETLWPETADSKATTPLD
nr:PAS domain-containing protein [Natrialba sp. INN-245]